MAKRILPIWRAPNRPSLFLGGDRELVLMCLLISVALIVMSYTLFAVIFGILFWIICLYLLRRMAKSDPLMRFIYIKHISYTRQKYYLAHSNPYTINRKEYK
jgi:type IV secretion system protein VirB3